MSFGSVTDLDRELGIWQTSRFEPGGGYARRKAVFRPSDGVRSMSYREISAMSRSNIGHGTQGTRKELSEGFDVAGGG